MPNQLIKTLLSALPRHAEEEGAFYSVDRKTLIDLLVRQHAVDPCIAEYTVGLCQRLLETLSVLRKEHLAKGEWCFESFPAQLLATSLLTALSDDESRFFPDNFWNTQGASDHTKDQQREVLHYLENARCEHHISHKASPIRYCYVAWGIIKLDGNILFYQREDTRRRYDKTAGDYGLIGGRANQRDLAKTMPPNSAIKLLLDPLQSPDSPLVREALPHTLQRELKEEAGLMRDRHYRFKPWRQLKAYRQVQGAAPNHALTEYYLEIFQIELTLDGYLFLQNQINHDERLVWFSVEDIARGERHDGKIAYIKALYDDFNHDKSELAKQLSELPDSFVDNYLSQREKYGITLPVNGNSPIQCGVLGKENALDKPMSDAQFGLLLGLASHLRGFEFGSRIEGIQLHPRGWVAVDNPERQRQLEELSQLFSGTDLLIEISKGSLFRLSIDPDDVFFDDGLFEFSVKQADLVSTNNSIPVIIKRNPINTALGEVKETSETFYISLTFANNLKRLVENNFSADHDDAIRIEDNYKKSLHKDKRFKALGLRNLIRRKQGNMKFVAKWQVL